MDQDSMIPSDGQDYNDGSGNLDAVRKQLEARGVKPLMDSPERKRKPKGRDVPGAPARPQRDVRISYNITSDEAAALAIVAKEFKGYDAAGIAAIATRAYLIQCGLVDKHGRSIENAVPKIRK